MDKKKIIFAHLLNNYTGAPKVLATELSLLQKLNLFDISLITSQTEGFLQKKDNIPFIDNGYRWFNNRILLAFSFCFAQLKFFLYVLFHKSDIVYINTVLPIGAVLAAKLKRKEIIYHVHEIYINPSFIKKFYYKIMKKNANKIICVSKYVQKCLLDLGVNSSVIYNPIEIHALSFDIDKYIYRKFNNKIIFMPTSLKKYKGIDVFVEIAKQIPNIRFYLLCSAPLKDIQLYFAKTVLPPNLMLIDKQKDLLNYYRESTITVNLSLPNECIETFGLTLIEGFEELTPAIAPDFGGPKEIIENKVNGFLVNPYDLQSIITSINYILKDFEVYKQFALNARKFAETFSADLFLKRILEEINN